MFLGVCQNDRQMVTPAFVRHVFSRSTFKNVGQAAVDQFIDTFLDRVTDQLEYNFRIGHHVTLQLETAPGERAAVCLAT